MWKHSNDWFGGLLLLKRKELRTGAVLLGFYCVQSYWSAPGMWPKMQKGFISLISTHGSLLHRGYYVWEPRRWKTIWGVLNLCAKNFSLSQRELRSGERKITKSPHSILDMWYQTVTEVAGTGIAVVYLHVSFTSESRIWSKSQLAWWCKWRRSEGVCVPFPFPSL